MDRRVLMLSVLSVAAVPTSAASQPARRVPRIGVLWHAGSEAEEAQFLAAFRQGLNDFSLVDGRNVLLENRFPAEQYERFNGFAAELIAQNVDVLVAVTPPAALAAQRATGTVPVVFILVADPVKMKLVRSLAYPGGNMTGLSQIGLDIMGKQLELLSQVVPNMRRVGILANPGNGEVHRQYVEAVNEAARPLGIAVDPVEMVSTPDAIEGTFDSYGRNKADGLIVLADGLFFNERKRIAEFALKARIPSIFLPMQYAEAGGLMSFGPNLAAMFRRAGYYVSKILEGTKPADLPVELPTRYTLAINLQTAKKLGLVIPQAVLLRADSTL